MCSRVGFELRSLGSTSTRKGFLFPGQCRRVGLGTAHTQRSRPALISPLLLSPFPFTKGLSGHRLAFPAQIPGPPLTACPSGHSPLPLRAKISEQGFGHRHTTVGNRRRGGGGAGAAHTPVQTQGQRQMTGLTTLPGLTDWAWLSAR